MGFDTTDEPAEFDDAYERWEAAQKAKAARRKKEQEAPPPGSTVVLPESALEAYEQRKKEKRKHAHGRTDGTVMHAIW